MFFSDEIYVNNENDVEEIKEFLNEYDVNYDFPDKTYVIRDKGKIIATGSADGNILKYFFSRKEYQGQGTMTTIFNSLLNYLIQEGKDSFFVFTTPNNTNIFKSLGLKQVYSTDKVSLFEGGFYNYKSWSKKLQKEIGPKQGKRGAIIMNCNPMTKGHKYLIDTALKDVEELIIFLVEEDKSIFPFKDRLSIVSEELKDYENIKIVPSGPYIISQATFPTYFIKRKDEMLQIYTDLDGSIFGEKIGKDLEIDIRFLGSEPTDMVTKEYNNSLKKILNENDIEVKIVERVSLDDEIISASYVRKLLEKGNIEESFKYLPNASIDYLKGDNGKSIIKKLQAKE